MVKENESHCLLIAAGLSLVLESKAPSHVMANYKL